jgi:pimeloyl-ACP methyl ester carboxylesterase
MEQCKRIEVLLRSTIFTSFCRFFACNPLFSTSLSVTADKSDIHAAAREHGLQSAVNLSTPAADTATHRATPQINFPGYPMTNPPEKINLLLLPGLLNDARLWQPQITALAEYADITVGDLTRHDSMAALADDVLAQAPPGPFALAGLSMGGYVALEIMRRAPERVLTLALLGTSARPDTDEGRAAREELIALAGQDWPKVTEMLLPKLLLPAHLENPTLVATIKAMANDLGKEVFVRQQHAIMNRSDSRPFLHRIHCPTLVLCGREDHVTPLETHEELVIAITGAVVEIVDQSGHLSTLEQPLAVIAALESWLQQLIRATADAAANSVLDSTLATAGNPTADSSMPV